MKYRPENQMAWIPEKENNSAIIKLFHLSIKGKLYFLILLLLSLFLHTSTEEEEHWCSTCSV